MLSLTLQIKRHEHYRFVFLTILAGQDIEISFNFQRAEFDSLNRNMGGMFTFSQKKSKIPKTTLDNDLWICNPIIEYETFWNI